MKLEEKKLPNGWEVRKLGEVCDIVYGKGLPIKELKSSGYPVFGANGIIGFNDKFLFEEPQVLISCRGAASGKINLSPPKCYVTNNSLVLDIKKKDELDRNYLFFALNIANKTKLVTGTAQPQVTINNAVELEIPLPPLPEQQKIVAKIEELFSELENGKKELLIAQAKLKTYRQSLLKWAFEGRLTNKNLKANELPKGWEVKRLGEVTSVLGDGLHGTPQYCDQGEYYFINGNNLTDGRIEIKENTKRVKFDEFKKYKKPLNEKTILVSINGTLGYTAFYNDEKVMLGKSACYFNVLDFVDKYYIRHFLTSNNFIKYANKNATGSTIKNVGLKTMRELQIAIPPLPEQQKIVAILESKLTICDAIEETIKTSIKQGEALRQSILKKAFEGQLIVPKIQKSLESNYKNKESKK